MSLPSPILVRDVFDDPDAVVGDVVERAPYWNQGRYLPPGPAAAATAPSGHPLARADGTAPPVFRADWAYGDPLIDGVDGLFNHPRFLAAACELFRGQIAVPYVLHVNLTAPGPAIDAGHTDVPAFRGLDRRGAPGWLLLAMVRSGLFDRWYVRTATAVTWLYNGPGGEFTYWPTSPDDPPSRHDELWNTALVGDNDRMFHRVEAVGSPEAPDLALGADSQLQHMSGGRFEVMDGDSVIVELDVADLRISLSWKAAVFADEDDHEQFATHADDVDLDRVHSIFGDALRSSGVTLAPSCEIDDPDFVQAVATAYPRSVPTYAP